MRRLRIHDELATDRLSDLEKGANPVHVAPWERYDRELFFEWREEPDRVRLDIGLGEGSAGIVWRDPCAFRDQDDRLRRSRGGDEFLGHRFPRPGVPEVPRGSDGALARVDGVA